MQHRPRTYTSGESPESSKRQAARTRTIVRRRLPMRGDATVYRQRALGPEERHHLAPHPHGSQGGRGREEGTAGGLDTRLAGLVFLVRGATRSRTDATPAALMDKDLFRIGTTLATTTNTTTATRRAPRSPARTGRGTQGIVAAGTATGARIIFPNRPAGAVGVLLDITPALPCLMR